MTPALAAEQCISLSNLPNTERTYRWLPNTTLTHLAEHRATRRELLEKPQYHGAPEAEWPYGLKVERGEGKGYAVQGKLRTLTAGSGGDPLLLRMFKSIVDTIGNNAVLAQLTLEAVMVDPEPGKPITRCVLEASLVFRKDD